MKLWFALGMLLLGGLAAHADELPALVYKDFSIAEESSPEVHALIKEAAGLVHPQPREGRRRIVEALTKVDKGARINEYDYLYALYGLLKSSHETNSSDFGPGTREDYIKVSRKAMAYLEKAGVGDWLFTPEGALKTEVYRTAGNGLAWYLYEDAKTDKKALDDALDVIERAEQHIRGSEDFFILDTKVRILLQLGRQDEAFKIVRDVLAEEPSFGDFADLREHPTYLAWLKKNKAGQPARQKD